MSAPRIVRAAAVAASFVAILLLDLATGVDVALRPLYLLPVAGGTWLLGRRFGFAFALASGAACVLFDLAGPLRPNQRLFLYTDAGARLFVYAGAVVLLARVQALQRSLGELALTDSLTAIANRRSFLLTGEREVLRARRTGAPLTLAHVDVDDFKRVNDTQGHAAGDALLVEVARVLAAGRGTDIAARLGGDEFALLLPDTDERDAHLVIARVRAEFREAAARGGWPVSLSIGVVTFRGPPDLAAVVRAADTRMYDAKRNGKDRVSWASEDGSSPSSLEASR